MKVSEGGNLLSPTINPSITMALRARRSSSMNWPWLRMPSASITMPSSTSAVPKFCAGAELSVKPCTCALRKNWKIVKPKEISDSEVRITDISVRSALSRVRWNAMPVRRAASAVPAS